MEYITAAESQYNDKKHVVIEQTLFVLNFEQYLWKSNLMVQTEFPKLEESLTELQKSWEEAMKSIKLAQNIMKKQFNKKR